VVFLQLPYPRPGFRSIRSGEGQKILPENGLTVVIPLRPAVKKFRIGIPEHRLLRRSAFPDLRRDIRVALRRLAKTLPCCLPGSFPPGEPDAARQAPFFFRVEEKLRLAEFAKRLPLVFAALRPESFPPVEPLQQIPNRVAPCQKGIEELLVEPPALQRIQILVKEGAQSKLHGVFRLPVLGGVQSQPSLVRLEERQDGPILGVVLRPYHPPVLQFGQGLQAVRAVFHGPEILPADAGEIQNGRPVRGQ